MSKKRGKSTAQAGAGKAPHAKATSAKAASAKPSAKPSPAKPGSAKPPSHRPHATRKLAPLAPLRPAPRVPSPPPVRPSPPPPAAAVTVAPMRPSAPPAPLPRAELSSPGVRPPWSIAPTLGWFAATTVLAMLALDGDLDAVVDLVHRDSNAATLAGAPGAGPSGPTGEDTPPPPLPPPPDLAPVAPTVAGTPPPAQPGVTIEEGCALPRAPHCTRYALDSVYRALAATEAGTATAPVRISFYGDSVSASDAIPGRLRARLQAVFGDGGPGFLHAIAPHRFNYSQQVERTSSGNWNVWNPALSRVPDDLYGVGLSTVAGSGTLRWRLRDPELRYAHAELYYLAQPRGGAADLIVDGKVAASVDTASDALAPGYQALTVADADHKLDLKTTRGKVRLFGVSLERDRGVVVDNLALVSATAANLSNVDEDHWSAQLAHRGADLIVFMIGTNEAQWLAGAKAMSEYEQEWAALLAPVRAGRPDASCLVVAPLDQAETRDDKLVPRRAMPRMIATQRRAAEAAGCAFWDSFTWMGGSGSAIKWNRRGLLGSDFAHPSPQGMAKVADALTDALIAGYRAYKGRTQP